MQDFYEDYDSQPVQPQLKPDKWVSLWVMLVIISLMLLIGFLSGCSRPTIGQMMDKAKYKADMSKVVEDKVIPAQKCATWFPTKEKIKTVTQYKQGKPIIKHDSVLVNCDSAIKLQTKYVRVKCPPSITIHDTIHTSDTIWSIDGAKIGELEILLTDMRAKANEAQDSSDMWRKWAYGLGIAWFVLIACILLYRWIAKGYKK